MRLEAAYGKCAEDEWGDRGGNLVINGVASLAEAWIEIY